MSSDLRPVTGRKLKPKSSPKGRASKSPGQVELLRRRVATAESLLIKAREQASQAKRRRKLAKLLAKRARKAAKQAKINLTDARATLAQAEAAMTAPIRRKSRVSKPVVRSAPPAPRKRLATQRKRRKPAPRSRLVPLTTGKVESTSPLLDAGAAQPAKLPAEVSPLPPFGEDSQNSQPN